MLVASDPEVIHADKCVLSANSHQENREWPAKVLGLASYGQDKMAESAQLSATAESNACSAVVHVFSLGNQGFWGTKRTIFSGSRRNGARNSFSQQGGTRKKGHFSTNSSFSVFCV